MGALHLVVLEEACRIADTLERLHGMAEGGDWLELARNEAESSASVVELRVVVNPLLAEIRQQQQVFRQKVAELRVAGRAVVPAVNVPGADVPAADEDPAAGSGEGGLGDLIDAAGRFTATH